MAGVLGATALVGRRTHVRTAESPFGLDQLSLATGVLPARPLEWKQLLVADRPIAEVTALAVAVLEPEGQVLGSKVSGLFSARLPMPRDLSLATLVGLVGGDVAAVVAPCLQVSAVAFEAKVRLEDQAGATHPHDGWWYFAVCWERVEAPRQARDGRVVRVEPVEGNEVERARAAEVELGKVVTELWYSDFVGDVQANVSADPWARKVARAWMAAEGIPSGGLQLVVSQRGDGPLSVECPVPRGQVQRLLALSGKREGQFVRPFWGGPDVPRTDIRYFVVTEPGTAAIHARMADLPGFLGLLAIRGGRATRKVGVRMLRTGDGEGTVDWGPVTAKLGLTMTDPLSFLRIDGATESFGLEENYLPEAARLGVGRVQTCNWLATLGRNRFVMAVRGLPRGFPVTSVESARAGVCTVVWRQWSPADIRAPRRPVPVGQRLQAVDRPERAPRAPAEEVAAESPAERQAREARLAATEAAAEVARVARLGPREDTVVRADMEWDAREREREVAAEEERQTAAQQADRAKQAREEVEDTEEREAKARRGEDADDIGMGENVHGEGNRDR
jgi:hypothetical protein